MSSRTSSVLLGAAAFAAAGTLGAPFLGDAIDFSRPIDREIFFGLRLPRALMGLACGAGLELCYHWQAMRNLVGNSVRVFLGGAHLVFVRW